MPEQGWVSIGIWTDNDSLKPEGLLWGGFASSALNLEDLSRTVRSNAAIVSGRRSPALLKGEI